MAEAAPAASNRKGSVRLGSYLKRLRAGYGYSLRRVEEKARAKGGEIDNSQLSRYEKGICYPSFDKLRVLASVFNVPVQAFSDVVDLEAFEDRKPLHLDDPEAIVQVGEDAVRAGDFPLAFASFERALELLESEPPSPERDTRIALARLDLAVALHRLGKLALAERELRQALRNPAKLPPRQRAQAVLNLANVHAEQGDLLLAEMEAERAGVVAGEEGEDLLAARALHTLGRVLAQQGRHAEAVETYRAAAERYERSDEAYEAIRIRTNIGDCYVAMGKSREGIRLIRQALGQAREGGHKRLEAQAWSCLGEAHYRQGDFDRARRCFRESDALAGPTHQYPDLLFFNAYYEWLMARDENHPTREKIALGRLKALRASVERTSPEVEAFDAFMERGRAHA